MKTTSLPHFCRHLLSWFATLAATALCLQDAWAAPSPAQQAYLKASNADAGDHFGHWSVAISADTVVIGAKLEASNATGVNGNQNNNLAEYSGAAYVFVRSGTNWTQQAYLKASNTEAGDTFGWSVAVSGDTVLIGSPYEDSNATGVNGNQNNNSAFHSGAAYVFVRRGTNWSQQAYLKASNTEAGDIFGWSVAVSGDTVLIGAPNEGSNATGVNGNQINNGDLNSGAAYVFVRSGTNWTQQAYLKASNTEVSDGFGFAVSISGDSVAVSAANESSNATGVNGNQNNNLAAYSGAAYVFVRSGTNWTQQAYLKASNPDTYDRFGYRLAIDGDTVAISADGEASAVSGVNGNQSDNSRPYAGAAYIFARSGTNWSQQAYLKASNTGYAYFFGDGVGVSGDVVVVGATSESSNATGVNGNQNNNLAAYSGAAYVFVRRGTNWTQQAYLKASNTEAGDIFGRSVAVSGDTVLIGAPLEDSNSTGVNGNQNNNNAPDSGAAYVFTGFCPPCPQLTLAPDGTGGYFIRYNGAPDLTYRLQRASSVDGPWDTIDTQTPPASGFVEFHDNNPPPDGAFYRAVQP